MSANAAEGLAYLALAARRDNAVSTAWVAHVFASDADNARFVAELLAVRR